MLIVQESQVIQKKEETPYHVSPISTHPIGDPLPIVDSILPDFKKCVNTPTHSFFYFKRGDYTTCSPLQCVSSYNSMT